VNMIMTILVIAAGILVAGFVSRKFGIA